MRFPVAVIAEKTGYDKGNISSMIKGKRPVSDNFYATFLRTFPLEEAIDNNLRDALLAEKEARRQDVEANLKKANEVNDRLLTMMEANLQKASAMIQSLVISQTAHDKTMMDSLDRLESNPKDTLYAKADKLEKEMIDKLNVAQGADNKAK